MRGEIGSAEARRQRRARDAESADNLVRMLFGDLAVTNQKVNLVRGRVDAQFSESDVGCLWYRTSLRSFSCWRIRR